MSPTMCRRSGRVNADLEENAYISIDLERKPRKPRKPMTSDQLQARRAIYAQRRMKLEEKKEERRATQLRRKKSPALVNSLQQAFESVYELARILTEYQGQILASPKFPCKLDPLSKLSPACIMSMMNHLNGIQSEHPIPAEQMQDIVAALGSADEALRKEIIQAIWLIQQTGECRITRMTSRFVPFFKNFEFELMPLGEADQDWQKLKLRFTFESERRLVNIFRINRQAETHRHATMPKSEMRLFYHGTRTGRVLSILRQGLKRNCQWTRNWSGVFGSGTAQYSQRFCGPCRGLSSDLFMFVFEVKEGNFTSTGVFGAAIPDNDRLADGTMLPQSSVRAIFVPNEEKIVLRYLIRFKTS